MLLSVPALPLYQHLLDRLHGDYESSFSESVAVHGPGVNYRYHSIRIPSPDANFHPKLYLLTRPGEATVFVSSANLTIPGFRSNAEVVDKLTSKEDGEEPRALTYDWTKNGGGIHGGTRFEL